MVTIKKIILLALTTLMMVGCRPEEENGEIVIYNQPSLINPYIQVLDSCEYIRLDGLMTHKGNCRFCKERRQKELEELVEQLKEK